MITESKLDLLDNELMLCDSLKISDKFFNQLLEYNELTNEAKRLYPEENKTFIPKFRDW